MNDLKRRELLKRTALFSTASWLGACGGRVDRVQPQAVMPVQSGAAAVVDSAASATAPAVTAQAETVAFVVQDAPAIDPIPEPHPLTPALAVMPAWRQGQAVNEWREIQGTDIGTLAATNEARTTAGERATGGGVSFGNRLGAWCGLSIDTRSSTIYAAANGGHGDYFGNEVVAVNLHADSPAWVEKRVGSSGNVVYTHSQLAYPADRKFAHYSDGLPASRHSYYGQQFIERQNRALTLGGSISVLGAFYENVESFNTLTNEWDAYDPETQAPPFGYAVGGINRGWTPAAGWSTCKDPRNECIYTIASGTMHRFVPAPNSVGGSWSVYGPAHPDVDPGVYAGTAVDTTRNRLVWMLGWSKEPQPYSCDLSTRVWTKHAFPPSVSKDAMYAAPALVSPGEPRPYSPGMVYVPQTDKFYIRMAAAGSRVYVVDAATFEVTELDTIGGAAVPQGAPFGDQQGVFNRWLYAPALQGVVYIPVGGKNVWFLRLY